MPHRTFNTEELAEYLHLSASDVERLLRESDLPRDERGGKLVFRRSEIDGWASQRILGLPGKRLDAYHAKSMRGTQELFPENALIPELLRRSYINLSLTSKTRASVIRDMVALAESTGKVFDPRELLASVEARETLCPTALPGGLALLHARNYDAYRFESSFIVLGRTIQSVPFSAPDGGPTRLFFLICCQDDRIHLHTLARLCLIAAKTDVLAQLYEASDAAAAYDLLTAAELAVLPEKPTA
jgi:mannitol/fructose-specific phosphotransferase system IIA component (Ntr-type)/predicted DNA-binding transcriptional regulator AlpA